MGSITVSNLGKAYKQYQSKWHRLAEWVLPLSQPRHVLHWVLSDLNFTVSPGDAVGIVGVNGAGKSTLLKLITGTTQPTTGSIAIQGRVAAMLELGMGFHPDFTGRQNVFNSGQLLGMSYQEIVTLMPEIEAFAEIGDYLDQPVRVYSSGMQMRLAFSVATVKRPDVLIIDEALSVGDTYFQHKSFERIREFNRLGTTLLLVSHDKQAIQAICNRAILLDGGKLAYEGEPEAVMDYYNAKIGKSDHAKIAQTVSTSGKIKTTSGSGEAEILSVRLVNQQGDAVKVVDVGEVVSLQIEVRVVVSIPELVMGYLIKDRLGQAVFGTNTFLLGATLSQVEANDCYRYQFSFPVNLGEGSYAISLAVHSSRTHLEANYIWQDMAYLFDVVNQSHAEFVGVAWLKPTWEVNRSDR